MEPQYSLESIMDEVSQPSAEQDNREYRPDGMGQVLAGMVPVMESNTGWTAIKHQGAE